VSTFQGEMVAASLTVPTLATIIDLSRLEIQAYVDETDIGRVHMGQKATFRVDSFPDHELQGQASAIYPKALILNNVVTYIVTVDIGGTQDLQIRPDMTVHVSFVLARKDNVISIPRTALIHEGGESFIVLHSADGWSKKPVITGLQSSQKIEIAKGLQDGDMIASDAQRWQDSRGDPEK
jgi:multidrug efflux pump subunit AcrA (membrane-fusion protein)